MRRGAIVLAGLASVVALTFVFSTPVRSTVIAERGGVVTEIVRSVDPLLLTYVLTQAVVAVLAVVACVLLVRNRLRPARTLLTVAGLLGLFPVVLPGMLALCALALLRRLPPPAPS